MFTYLISWKYKLNYGFFGDIFFIIKSFWNNIFLDFIISGGFGQLIKSLVNSWLNFYEIELIKIVQY